MDKTHNGGSHLTGSRLLISPVLTKFIIELPPSAETYMYVYTLVVIMLG